MEVIKLMGLYFALNDWLKVPGARYYFYDDCIDLQEDPSLKKRYLTELKSMDEDTLTEEDLGYLMDQLREFDTIIAYVRSIMARRAGERVEEEEVQAAPKKKRGRPKKKKSKAGKSPMEDLDEEL